MANGVDRLLLHVINELSWSMIVANKEQAREKLYKDMLIASIVGGFNIANSHYIANSMKGNPDNIYKTTGIGFGVLVGFALAAGNKNTTDDSVMIDGKVVKVGLKSKTAMKIITKMLLHKVLQRFISPITKLVHKLIKPLLVLPKYADLFDKINGNAGANEGKVKGMFLRFILWLFVGAVGTMIAIKLYAAYKNDIDAKDVVKSPKFMDVSEMATTSIGSPNISQALKINDMFKHKAEFSKEFAKKQAGAVSVKSMVQSASSIKDVDAKTVTKEYNLLIDELRDITNGKVYISLTGKVRSGNQAVKILRAIKSIMISVKTTTEVAKFKFKSIKLVIYNVNSINIENIGLYNASINILDGSTQMLFHATENNSFQLTNDEVTSVMLHECGHYLTRQNSFFHINMSLGLLTMPLQLFMNPVTSAMVWGSFFHMADTYGRYQEIQADKYATQLGYGNELASALAKLYRLNPKEITHLSNTDNSDVHSTLKLRYDTLKQYSSKFNKK